MSDVVLSAQEVQEIAGGYKRPGDQLRELHRQGFYRARLGRVTGHVILERAHYEAVISGRFAQVAAVDITPIVQQKRRGPAAPLAWDQQTALYRHFDVKGRLLYVGIATHPEKRQGEHRREAPWRDRIHRVDVEWFETRRMAMAAECAAIKAERPKYNVLHARKT